MCKSTISENFVEFHENPAHWEQFRYPRDPRHPRRAAPSAPFGTSLKLVKIYLEVSDNMIERKTTQGNNNF